MPSIRNISGDALVLPWLSGRLVQDGQVIDVPPVDAPRYLCQPGTWAPADTDAEHLSGLDPDDPPALNASTDVWRAWSALLPGVDPGQVALASREDLQARYAPQRAEPDPDPEPVPPPVPAPTPVTRASHTFDDLED